MTQTTQREASAVRRPSTDARFRSVLVPVDLTAVADRVLGRVALLPLARDARVTLLHVVPPGLAARDAQIAERDAKKYLASEAKHLARSLPRGVKVESAVQVGAPAKVIPARAKSLRADLIVVGRGSPRVLRDGLLGSTAERIIRGSSLPVLVVRLPARTPYKHPAVALEIDEAAHRVIDTMLRVIPPPRPPVAVIHAVDMSQVLVYPSLSREAMESYCDDLSERASRQLTKLLRTAVDEAGVPPRDAPGWRFHIQCGSARLTIEKAVDKLDTDLLVLGTRGRRGISHMFLGSIAGDVLREVSCDVLVVPPDRS